MNTLSLKARRAFPNSEDLDISLKKLFKSIDYVFAINTVKRQIFSERERYTVKAEVDEALLSSSIISKTGNLIKNSCKSNDIKYVDDYLDLLSKNLEQLTNICIDFCQNFNLYEKNEATFIEFLNKYLLYADEDNAHAMYLSSDNWEFSVFNNIISKLQTAYKNPKEFENILKGNIIDIRTYIYKIAGRYVQGLSLENYVINCLEHTNIVTNDLWSPILLHPFSSKKSSDQQFSINYTPPETPIIAAYNDLYHARYLYDSFEYFGFYGFVRNAIAELCQKYALNTSQELFRSYSKYITLYQFNFCQYVKI